jgi:hypothetical protein
MAAAAPGEALPTSQADSPDAAKGPAPSAANASAALADAA